MPKGSFQNEDPLCCSPLGMSNPWDTSAGPPPSLLQALGMGHLGEVLAQGPSFEAVLAQSPGAEPRLSPTSAALRRSSPPRGSAAPWLSSSALRSAAPCRAAGGCGPGAPRSPWGAGWKGGGGVPAVRRPGWMRGGCRAPLPAPPKPEEERCRNPLPVCCCPAARRAWSSAGGADALRASVCGRTDEAEQQQQPFLRAAPFLYLVRDAAFPSITHTTHQDPAPSPFLLKVFPLTCWKTGSAQLGSFFFVATITGVWWKS